MSDRIWPEVAWYDAHVFWPAVALRYATLLALAAWAFAQAVPARSSPEAVAV